MIGPAIRGGQGDTMARDEPAQREGGLTPVVRRRIESSAAIQEAATERITYQHTVLCQTALPYRDPGDTVREWERQQGAVALKVNAGEARDPQTRRFVKLALWVPAAPHPGPPEPGGAMAERSSVNHAITSSLQLPFNRFMHAGECI
jgi:hypothetical protein